VLFAVSKLSASIAMSLRVAARWVLVIYLGLLTLSAMLAFIRLSESTAMPGLAAIEHIFLALPWSFIIGVEPISRLSWHGMFAIVFAGLVSNFFLLGFVARLLEARHAQGADWKR